MFAVDSTQSATAEVNPALAQQTVMIKGHCEGATNVGMFLAGSHCHLSFHEPTTWPVFQQTKEVLRTPLHL